MSSTTTAAISGTALYVTGALIAFGAAPAWTFYLPGLAPVNYCPADLANPQCQVSERFNIFQSLLPISFGLSAARLFFFKP